MFFSHQSVSKLFRIALSSLVLLTMAHSQRASSQEISDYRGSKDVEYSSLREWSTSESSVTGKIGPEIFRDDQIAVDLIYPRGYFSGDVAPEFASKLKFNPKSWCIQTPEFGIRYVKPREDLSDYFAEDQISIEFYENILLPELQKHCPQFPYTRKVSWHQQKRISTVEVKAYKVVKAGNGRMVFVNPTSDPGPNNERLNHAKTDQIDFFLAADGSILDVQRESHRKIVRAVNQEKRRVRDEKIAQAEDCAGQPFCELPGGIYLSAIYRGDAEYIRYADKKMARVDKTGDPIKDALLSTIKLSNFIDNAALLYVDDYQNRSEQCFASGGITITKQATSDKIIERDGYGNRTGSTYGGETSYKTYRVNSRLAGYCRRNCDVNGRTSAVYFTGISNSSRPTQIIRGLEAIKERYDCNAPEVAQFERNLSQLAN